MTLTGVLAVVAAGCGGSDPKSEADATSVGDSICAGASSDVLNRLFGETPSTGTAVDPQSGVHGCWWKDSAGDLLIGVEVFEDPTAVPSGDTAEKQIATLLGVDDSGYSLTSVSTSTSSEGALASAVLVLSNATDPPSSDDISALADGARSAATSAATPSGAPA
jgi:hypothetical protein